jgi:hypothetical protein
LCMKLLYAIMFRMGSFRVKLTLFLQEQFETEQISPPKAKSQAAKPITKSKPPPSKKRASTDEDEGGKAKKQRKFEPAVSSEEALSSPPSELSEEEKPQTTSKPKPKQPAKKSAHSTKPAKSKAKPEPRAKASESKLSDEDDSPPAQKNAEASDSDLSVLIDEGPKPKKKRKGSAPSEKRGRKPSAAKPKADNDTDPDSAEIKRLQSWLVKCGIRKLWGKELKPYETPKAKIKHLKDMLSDAGMTGRYSLEKANQIKEERELRADIEAVKEGAERWGKEKNAKEEESVDGDGRTKPKRRLIRGAQILDFLGSDDGEETD